MPKFSFSSLLDQFSLAFQGLFLAVRKKDFWITFVLCFCLFGTLLNLFSNGFSSFRLLFAGDLSLSWKILSSAFLGVFGVGKAFSDWLLNFVLTLVQATLFSLIIFLARANKSKSSEKTTKSKKSARKAPASAQDTAPSLSDCSSALESSALVTGLIVLGSGCPTCGTTLLAPVIATFVSGAAGGVALAGKISLALNLFAIILGLLVFRRLGMTTYATIKSESRTPREQTE